VEAKEIFELILKADDALKYATEDKLPARARQARQFLVMAREEARAAGNESLVQQAEQRLTDLDSIIPAEPGQSGDAP